MRVRPALKGRHHLGAGRLAQVPVDALGLVARFGQVGGELIDHLLGVAEHDGPGRVVGGQQQTEHIHLAPHRAVKVELLDVLGGAGATAAHRHRLRLLLVGPGDLEDRLGHRRGEEQRLALRRRLGQDGLDVLPEAHIQHLVRLVQDGQPQGGEPQRPPAQMVHHPPRCADDEVGPPLQLVDLPLHRGAAVHRRHLDPGGVAGKFLHLGCGLHRQLPGRAEHQHLHPLGLRVDAVDGRQAEGGGLAGAGVGPADQVPARQDQRDALCLDRGRLGVADLRHRPADAFGKGKVLKYHKNTSLSLRPGPLPQRICPPADGVFPFGRKKQAAPVSPAPPVLLLWVIVYHTLCSLSNLFPIFLTFCTKFRPASGGQFGGCPLRPPAGLQRVGGAAHIVGSGLHRAVRHHRPHRLPQRPGQFVLLHTPAVPPAGDPVLRHCASPFHLFFSILWKIPPFMRHR